MRLVLLLQPITADVRVDSAPSLDPIAVDTTVNITQGILFGIPPSFIVSLDLDSDGINDDVDNCPSVANADQLDTDADVDGDVCDSTPNGDDDLDTIDNLADNCPVVSNANQLDTDADGAGDVCDAFPADTDNDGISNNGDYVCRLLADGSFSCGYSLDNCPAVANTDQLDTDNDGAGDVCDAFPNDADNDIDGDTVGGDIDNCPADANSDQLDTDGDS